MLQHNAIGSSTTTPTNWRARGPLGVRSVVLITSSDDEYKATKRIKQGNANLVAPFDELAAWIGDRWHVTVPNVIYDRPNDLHAPRIQVILEHETDAHVFRDGFNFDETKQQEIAS